MVRFGEAAAAAARSGSGSGVDDKDEEGEEDKDKDDNDNNKWDQLEVGQALMGWQFWPLFFAMLLLLLDGEKGLGGSREKGLATAKIFNFL